jgi:ATP phosphoribosyltransferase
VAGRDVLLESGVEGLYAPVDLASAAAACAWPRRAASTTPAPCAAARGLRIATNYVRAAREHFARKGVHVDLIKLYGSMELAPLVGLADAIVDLVSTGSTLRANDLAEVEEIMPISSRLVVNRASLKTKSALLAPLLASLERAARP